MSFSLSWLEFGSEKLKEVIELKNFPCYPILSGKRGQSLGCRVRPSFRRDGGFGGLHGSWSRARLSALEKGRTHHLGARRLQPVGIGARVLQDLPGFEEGNE